jgi:hypothetical protein
LAKARSVPDPPFPRPLSHHGTTWPIPATACEVGARNMRGDPRRPSGLRGLSYAGTRRATLRCSGDGPTKRELLGCINRRIGAPLRGMGTDTRPGPAPDPVPGSTAGTHPVILGSAASDLRRGEGRGRVQRTLRQRALPWGGVGPVAGPREYLVRQERETPRNDEKRRNVGDRHPAAPGLVGGPDAGDGNDGGPHDLRREPSAAGGGVGPLGHGGTQQYDEGDTRPDPRDAGKRETGRPWLPSPCHRGRVTPRSCRRRRRSSGRYGAATP